MLIKKINPYGGGNLIPAPTFTQERDTRLSVETLVVVFGMTFGIAFFAMLIW